MSYVDVVQHYDFGVADPGGGITCTPAGDVLFAHDFDYLARYYLNPDGTIASVENPWVPDAAALLGRAPGDAYVQHMTCDDAGLLWLSMVDYGGTSGYDPGVTVALDVHGDGTSLALNRGQQYATDQEQPVEWIDGAGVIALSVDDNYSGTYAGLTTGGLWEVGAATSTRLRAGTGVFSGYSSSYASQCYFRGGRRADRLWSFTGMRGMSGGPTKANDSVMQLFEPSTGSLLAYRQDGSSGTSSFIDPAGIYAAIRAACYPWFIHGPYQAYFPDPDDGVWIVLYDQVQTENPGGANAIVGCVRLDDDMNVVEALQPSWMLGGAFGGFDSFGIGVTTNPAFPQRIYYADGGNLGMLAAPYVEATEVHTGPFFVTDTSPGCM